MTHDDRRALAHQALALSSSPWLRHVRGRHLVQHGIAFNSQEPQGPSFNYAAVLIVKPPLDRVLALADAFFAGREGGYGVLVEGDVGHPLEAELRARGWKVFEDEPALILPAIPPRDELLALSGRADLSIQIVSDEARMQDWRQTVAVGFGMPPEKSDTPMPGLACALDPDIALLVGYHQGKSVAASMLYRVAGVALISGMATLPEHRGRGFGAALLRAALAEGARRGSVSAGLRSGPLSVPLYKRLGFMHTCWHRTYVRDGQSV
jgi:GNAT superfamily N-acetyltransferase